MLSIEVQWEALESGRAEDRASFACIGIRWQDQWLTEAEDTFVRTVRQKVHLSAYRLAEWFAWNWWRLRWEPRRSTLDWAMSHRTATIGGGYVWPNLTIDSDGEYIYIEARPTEPRPAEPLRCLSHKTASIPREEFTGAINTFIEQVSGRVAAMGVADSNLDAIWQNISADRQTPEQARYRKFEALLGSDPGEGAESRINSLLQDAAIAGEGAMAELAASDVPLTVAELREIADRRGSDIEPCDLPSEQSCAPTRSPAWQQGVSVAQKRRTGDQPMTDATLCEMAGVKTSVLDASSDAPPLKELPFSFLFRDKNKCGRVVLRSRHPAGRRFALARLVGDCWMAPARDSLCLATSAHTYRQKVQHAFATELLCPWNALAARLAGDFSTEAIEDAARHFNVPEQAVLTQLAHHPRIQENEPGADATMFTTSEAR